MAGFNQMLGQIKGKAENLTARIVETSSQEKDGATIKGLKQRKAKLVQEKQKYFGIGNRDWSSESFLWIWKSWWSLTKQSEQSISRSRRKSKRKRIQEKMCVPIVVPGWKERCVFAGNAERR